MTLGFQQSKCRASSVDPHSAPVRPKSGRSAKIDRTPDGESPRAPRLYRVASKARLRHTEPVHDAPNQMLMEALEASGLAVEAKEGWVEVVGTDTAVRAMAHVEVSEDGARLQLDVQVSLPDGRLLTESHAASGADPGAALRSAIGMFVSNSLPALHAGLFGASADEFEGQGEMAIAGEAWRVAFGPVGLQVQAPPGAPALDPAVEPPVAPPPALFEVLQRLVRDRPRAPAAPSWFRMFIAFQANERLGVEALWNGMHWPEAEAALCAIDWPAYEGFFTMRCFSVLRPVDPPAPSWPYDYRTTVEQVRAVAERIEANPRLSEDDLVEALIDDGLDYTVAEALACFVPAGFAYQLLGDVGLPGLYGLADEDGTNLGMRALEAEPAFVAAVEVAASFEATGRGSLVDIAIRSEVFRQVHGALEAGRPVPHPHVVRIVEPEDFAAPAPWMPFESSEVS